MINRPLPRSQLIYYYHNIVPSTKGSPMKLLLPLLLLLSSSLFAEDIMKIYLKESATPTEEAFTSMSKIVFSETAMISAASYNLDDILKIEFIEENTSIFGGEVVERNNSVSSNESLGINLQTTQINLTLEKTTDLSVGLYSVNGRKVAQLFTGVVSSGSKNIPFNRTSTAAGVYSIVIKADNVVYVKKIALR